MKIKIKKEKQEFKFLEAAQHQAKESPRYVAPETDRFPGSDVDLRPYYNIEVVSA